MGNKEEKKECRYCLGDVQSTRKNSFCSDICEKDWHTNKAQERVLVQMSLLDRPSA